MSSGLGVNDRLAIADLSYRYAACIDDRDFAALDAVFTSDGVLRTARGERQGLKEIQTAMDGLLRFDSTMHVVGQVRAWRNDNDEVRADTYCVAHHFTSADGGTTNLTMYIRYADLISLGPPGWRIAERSLHVAATTEQLHSPPPQP